jgi:tripeptidyl-peptidase-1
VILIGDKYFLISGTGASASVFAAFVSLVNSVRIAAGNPPLGWINPGVYA